MKRQLVISSAIKSIGYDSNKAILQVEILNTGKVYEYYGVPVKEYRKFLKASSFGTYYNTKFKQKFGKYYAEVF